MGDEKWKLLIARNVTGFFNILVAE